MNYSDFQNQASSEKLTLAKLNAAKRLIAFELHSGSVYKKTGFDVAVIQSITMSGTALTEVASLALVVANTFYNDRENQTLYLQTSDSADPNSKFLTLTYTLFFASGPVTLPYDLSTGFDVYWEPSIRSTSQFGVEIDTVNQANEAIEGSGSLSLFNDGVFWKANFDKLTFDNQSVEIYSFNRDLEATEAKLLFKGKIESKSYSPSAVSFRLKDLMSELRASVQLSTIEDLGLRNDPSLNQAKQRMIFGRVQGHRPVNIDSLINGSYPLTGTVAITNGSATITGTSTVFKTELSPEDQIIINSVTYTVASVSSDTSLTLTDNVTQATASGFSTEVKPKVNKRYINRIWKLAGHVLRQPTVTVQNGSSTSRLVLSSTQDMYAGDTLYVGTLGSGELTTINDVVNATVVNLSTSLTVIPPIDTEVHRPCVQNVRLDDIQLQYYRDYTVDPDTATLTLGDDAEENAAPTIESTEQISTSSGSATVTGSGTSFKSYLKPGYLIRPKGYADWYQILSVNSDTSITLTDNYPSTLGPLNVQYKSYVFGSDSVLSCEVLGRTSDGIKTGSLLKTAPKIVEKLLTDIGLSTVLNSASFTAANDIASEELGFCIPEKFNETKTVTYRDVINNINKSVFGLLIQNSDFELKYDVLQPVIPTSYKTFREADCLNLKAESTNKNMIRVAKAQYGKKEYDYSIKIGLVSTVSKSSDIAEYIVGTSKEKIFDSYLVNETDAQRLANRWSFLLENSTSQVEITTKLQAMDLSVNDIICVDHSKLYTRFAGASTKKYVAIESIQKSGTSVIIQAVDLSNAFNRIALISDTTSTFADSNEDTRIVSGFITDANGLIDNDEDSFGTSLIW